MREKNIVFVNSAFGAEHIIPIMTTKNNKINSTCSEAMLSPPLSPPEDYPEDYSEDYKRLYWMLYKMGESESFK